ncbi:MAG TPA: HRDC domain-containing protein, partial [Acidimicrobiales bacterium]|nr:HRDC domain-containing protein [Acidimicrobiales bacterium]
MAAPGTPPSPDPTRGAALRRTTEPSPSRRRSAAAAGDGPEPDERVWERLRAWRSERAKAAKVPPYVVFDDKTLRLIAVALPVTERDLLSLKGIGPGKFESYGSELIALAEELRTGPA